MKLKRQRQRAASARFELKDRKEKETLIYLLISIDRKRVKWSTGEKVKTSDWPKPKKKGQRTPNARAIVRARDTQTQALNERLDRYANAAVNLFNDWELNTAPGLANYNPDKFKQELEYRLGFAERPDDKTEKLDTSDFVRFAEAVRDHRKDSTGIKRGTWKVLNNHVNLLREFADLRHGGTVAFNEVDELFIEGFKKFLFRTKDHNRRTVHKVMVTLRSIASRAADRDLMTYGRRFRSWAKQDFRKMPQPALTRSELDKVIALDLSDAPRLERVRDLFLIGIATAQRWSDYSILTPKNFRQLPGGGYRYFIQSQQKTSKEAGGPVMDWIIPTLEKYGYIGSRDFDPPKISPQRFNDYLKEVVKRAIPDATITVYNDREQIDHEGAEFAKWEKISSHAARRTAVGLLRSMKAPDDQIQKMTGHTTLSEMDGYDVRDAETLALELGRDLNAAWNKGKLRAV